MSSVSSSLKKGRWGDATFLTSASLLGTSALLVQCLLLETSALLLVTIRIYLKFAPLCSHQDSDLALSEDEAFEGAGRRW